MPVNHGLHCKLPPPAQRGKIVTEEERMKFRYGIYAIFDGLKRGSFLLGKPEHIKAAQLEYHFQHVCERFIFILQHLGGLLPKLLQATTEERHLLAGMRTKFEAECEADHVLSYLSSIVDDIALAVVLVTGVSHPKQRTESMGDLKHPAVIGLPALAPINSLLRELDNPGSWWNLAFKPHAGARQLLVHNQHLVVFQVQKSGGQGQLLSMLQSPFSRPQGQGTVACSDFLGGCTLRWPTCSIGSTDWSPR
jgi:hypothetical protein